MNTPFCPLQLGPFVMQCCLHFAAVKLLCNAEDLRCANIRILVCQLALFQMLVYAGVLICCFTRAQLSTHLQQRSDSHTCIVQVSS